MQSHSRYSFLPTSFELWCIALSSFALLLVGNARLLLERYGLVSSTHVVGQQLSGHFTSGLGVVDSFSFTPGLVTLIVWGGVGILIFSLTQACVRASAAVSYKRQLGSNRFVHPTGFNRQTYWHQVLSHTALSFGALALLIVAAALYLLFVIPVSFYYAQTFLLDASLAHLAHLLIGIFVALAGTTTLYCIAKFARQQHL